MVDTEFYSSLKKLTDIDYVSVFCWDFTFLENYLGEMKTIELVWKGASIKVTKQLAQIHGMLHQISHVGAC